MSLLAVKCFTVWTSLCCRSPLRAQWGCSIKHPAEKRAVKQFNAALRPLWWIPKDVSKSESSREACSLKVGLFTRLLLVLINCKTSRWVRSFYWRADSCISPPFKLNLRDEPLESLCVAVICVPLHFIVTDCFFSPVFVLVLHNRLSQTPATDP